MELVGTQKEVVSIEWARVGVVDQHDAATDAARPGLESSLHFSNHFSNPVSAWRHCTVAWRSFLERGYSGERGGVR